ncbi:MAG: hypothetical protein WBE76_01315 [Terracidiphilus sp.]
MTATAAEGTRASASLYLPRRASFYNAGRMGVCHTCESGLIDGRIGYAPEPLDRPVDGNVLICCTTPLTAVELDL